MAEEAITATNKFWEKNFKKQNITILSSLSLPSLMNNLLYKYLHSQDTLPAPASALADCIVGPNDEERTLGAPPWGTGLQSS